MTPDIIRAYTEPHRHYHTLDHLVFMFRKAKEFGWELTDELCYAICYHDFVYEIGAEDNEARSAEAFKEFRFQHFDEPPYIGDHSNEQAHQTEADFVTAVSKAIVSTRNHIPLEALFLKSGVDCFGVAAQLIDLDLAILAEPFSANKYDAVQSNEFFGQVFPDIYLPDMTFNLEYAYDAYLVGIREEYDPKYTPKWDAERSKWLRGMLDREHIFWTSEGRKLEAPARKNLNKELQMYYKEGVTK